MSEKVVKFSTLGRKEIKALIYTENGEVKTEYNQDKIAELQKKIEKPILIYNPTNEKRMKMQLLIAELGNKSLNNKLDFIIEAKDLVLKFLPLCTNVILDLDEVEDAEIIKDIVENPSDEFNVIIVEVTNLTKGVSQDYIKTIKAMSELPKEELDKLLVENTAIEETEEEKEIRELEEKLNELKNKKVDKNE